MYIYIYLYIYLCVRIHIYIHIYTSIYIHIYMHIHICIRIPHARACAHFLSITLTPISPVMPLPGAPFGPCSPANPRTPGAPGSPGRSGPSEILSSVSSSSRLDWRIFLIFVCSSSCNSRLSACALARSRSCRLKQLCPRKVMLLCQREQTQEGRRVTLMRSE